MGIDHDVRDERERHRGSGGNPRIIEVTDYEFQCEVLEKLGRLEVKVDMLVGDGQPGRMKLAEDRIGSLERNDARRGVYDRIVNAFIAIAISGAIALREHLGLR